MQKPKPLLYGRARYLCKIKTKLLFGIRKRRGAKKECFLGKKLGKLEKAVAEFQGNKG